MKKIFSTLLIATLLVGCGPEGSSFVLRGEFKDLKEGELFIYDQTNGEERFDTIRVREGEFLYKGDARKLTPYTLVFPNAVEQVIFINGGDALTYEASAKDLRNYKVSGNEENELMNMFREETKGKNAAQVRETAQKYIKENTLSPISIHLFDRYFVQDEQVPSEDLRPLLELLSTTHPQNLFLLNIEGRLNNAGKGKVGSLLPSITLPTKEKDTIDIAKIESDYTLIIYWATWCEGAYDIVDRIREVRKEYKSTDSLCIISASADTEIYRWQDYSRDDSVGIHNYCEGMAWDAPIIDSLDIKFLPAYIIADKEHKIISKRQDDNLKELLSEIKKLFDKK